MEKAASLRQKLWRPSAEERRRLLMPFFWTELVKQGVVLGNPELNSRVQVSNAFRVSYPGYSEILTGRAQDEKIRGNDRIQNPTPTIFEFVREKLGLTKSQTALFASWDVFAFIGESRPGSIYLDAGNQRAEPSSVSARSRELSQLQPVMLTPWDSVRHDYLTFELARDYLRTAHPRLMQISLGEMDDWAHDRRYDRVLESIGYFDSCLKVALVHAAEYARVPGSHDPDRSRGPWQRTGAAGLAFPRTGCHGSGADLAGRDGSGYSRAGRDARHPNGVPTRHRAHNSGSPEYRLPRVQRS
jgi:hypothetical protein